MDKKEFTAGIFVVILSILFVIVSLLLFFSKGKSKFLTAKKIKIGALLLSLSTFPVSCVTTCYDMPAQFITLENNSQDTIFLNLNESNQIRGAINDRIDDSFSYSINNDSVIFLKDNLTADDGKFDENNEEFTLKLSDNIVPGDYSLNFYASDVQNIENSYTIGVFRLKVTDEK